MQRAKGSFFRAYIDNENTLNGHEEMARAGADCRFSVAKFLRHDQPVNTAIHDTDADTPELPPQNIGAVSGRVHQAGMGEGDAGSER